MPKRITEYRLLDDSLRLYLSEHDQFGDDGWPKYKELFAYVREQLDWNASEREYKSLKRHGTAPAKLVEGLLRYLGQNSRRRLVEFGIRQGVPETQVATPTYLLEQFSSLCDGEQVSTNWRAGGWRNLSAMFAAAFIGDESRFLCRESREISELCRWVMSDVGRLLADAEQGAHGLSEESLIAVAERKMQRTLAEYIGQVAGWWAECPWTVMHALYGDEIVGGSVVLPLCPSIYRKLRDQQISDLDIRPEDIQYPSRWLLAEAMTTSFGESSRLRIGWVTARQVATIIFQAARLSWAVDTREGAGQPIHVLCIGGTSEACERLKRHGYAQIGILHGFDVPLFELVWPAPESNGWLPTSAAQAYSGVIAACYARIRNSEES